MPHPLPALAVRLLGAALLALLPPALAAAGTADPAMSRPLGEPPRGTPPSLYGRELALPDTLGVGRVSADVAHDLPRVEALTDWLNTRAVELGWSRALPVLARDQEEMARYLESGIVDLVSEEPMEAMHDVEEAGASVLLGERRAGHDSYRAVVFVRQDSRVRTLEELAEECVAFPGGDSGDSFLLPLAELRGSGMRLARISGPAGDPGPGEGGYFVLGPDTSTTRSVQQRIATAGASSNEDFEREESRGNTQGLRILHTFDSVPRSLVVVGAGMGAARREALARVLVEMAGDAAGKEALRAYGDVTAYDRVEGGLAVGIERVRSLYALVREEAR